MNNKKIIIIGILLITIVLGITYAWWSWSSSTNTNVTFAIDGATITYSGGPDIQNIKLIPVSSKEKGETDGTGVAKEITASSNKDVYLNLNLDLVTFPSQLAHQSLVWEIYKGNTKIGNGNFNGKVQGDSISLFTNQLINSTTSTYKLYIWIDGNQDNSNDMMNKSFVFHLNASASDEAPKSALPEFILNSNAPLDSVNSTYVTGHYEHYSFSNEDKETLKTYLMNNSYMSSELADRCIEEVFCIRSCLTYYNQANNPDIDLIGSGNLIPGVYFIKSSSDTNGKGLYIRSGTENNLNPIYYYRGAVENNNVYFANYCWKIVRTTDTGGLKMIYNGTSTSGTCGTGTTSQEYASIGYSEYNTSHDDIKYAGYTYDNNGVETDSTIKGVVDAWYRTNLLTNYDNYIEDTVYCNDKSLADAQTISQYKIQLGYSESDDVTFFGPYVRFNNATPSLECTNNDDKYTKSSLIGNGKLTYPIGLLTMDETLLAGIGLYGNQAENYFNIKDYWWTLSPLMSRINPIMWQSIETGYEFDNGSINNHNVHVRPVISLKPEYNTFTYGNGTTANPYRFVETIPSS